jgi:hypothetical protein
MLFRLAGSVTCAEPGRSGPAGLGELMQSVD